MEIQYQQVPTTAKICTTPCIVHVPYSICVVDIHLVARATACASSPGWRQSRSTYVVLDDVPVQERAPLAETLLKEPVHAFDGARPRESSVACRGVSPASCGKEAPGAATVTRLSCAPKMLGCIYMLLWCQCYRGRWYLWPRPPRGAKPRKTNTVIVRAYGGR